MDGAELSMGPVWAESWQVTELCTCSLMSSFQSRGLGETTYILWMDEILHHLGSHEIIVCLYIPTSNDFLRFQSGAGICPSTVFKASKNIVVAGLFKFNPYSKDGTGIDYQPYCQSDILNIDEPLIRSSTPVVECRNKFARDPIWMTILKGKQWW